MTKEILGDEVGAEFAERHGTAAMERLIALRDAGWNAVPNGTAANDFDATIAALKFKSQEISGYGPDAAYDGVTGAVGYTTTTRALSAAAISDNIDELIFADGVSLYYRGNHHDESVRGAQVSTLWNHPNFGGTMRVIGGTGLVAAAYSNPISGGLATAASLFAAAEGVDIAGSGIRTLINGDHTRGGLSQIMDHTLGSEERTDTVWFIGNIVAVGLEGIAALKNLSTAGKATLKQTDDVVDATECLAKNAPKRNPFTGTQPPLPSDAKNFSDFGNRVIQWGRRNDAARNRMMSITMEELRGSGMTSDLAVQWRDFYRNVARTTPNNPSATGRADLMDWIARMLAD